MKQVAQAFLGILLWLTPIQAAEIVYHVAFQGDNLIVSGQFQTFNGQNVSYICRTDPATQVDPTFLTEADSYVYKTLVLSDGSMVIVGGFSQINGVPRKGFAKLNADGSLDESIDSPLGNNGSIKEIIPLKSGKYLVGGGFTTMGGQSHKGLARLNSDFTTDHSFQVGAGADVWETFAGYTPAAVNKIYELNDGRILAGGTFINWDSSGQKALVLLDENGNHLSDHDFAVDFYGSLGFSGVYDIVPDGEQFLIAGAYNRIGGTNHGNLARIALDGTVDETLYDHDLWVNSSVQNIYPQGDGYILAGGFSKVSRADDAPQVGKIARIFQDGSQDTSFNAGEAGANSTVFFSTLHNHKLYVAGHFDEFNDEAVSQGLAILNLQGEVITSIASARHIIPEDNRNFPLLKHDQNLLIHQNSTNIFFQNTGIHAKHLRIYRSNGSLNETLDLMPGESTRWTKPVPGTYFIRP